MIKTRCLATLLSGLLFGQLVRSIYRNSKLVFPLRPVGEVPERELMHEYFTRCKRRNLNCRIVRKGFIKIEWRDGDWKVGATVHLGGSTESHANPRSICWNQQVLSPTFLTRISLSIGLFRIGMRSGFLSFSDSERAEPGGLDWPTIGATRHIMTRTEQVRVEIFIWVRPQAPVSEVCRTSLANFDPFSFF